MKGGNERRENPTDGWSRDFISRASDYVDGHLREFQYGVYGVGFIGLAITVRSLRVFGQFKTVAKIPKEYFKKNITLRGIIRDVDSSNNALLVEHLPVVRLFGSGKNRLLPVRLSGISMGPMGCQWLKTTTKDNNIQFVLLASNQNLEAESIVTVSEGFLKKRCLNSEIVRVGMGQVAPKSNTELAKNKLYRKLYTDLLAVQVEAIQDDRGLWFSSTRRPKTSVKSLITRILSTSFNNLKSSVIRLPALIKQK